MQSRNVLFAYAVSVYHCTLNGSHMENMSCSASEGGWLVKLTAFSDIFLVPVGLVAVVLLVVAPTAATATLVLVVA